MSDTNHTGTHTPLGMRLLATACAVIVLIAGALVLEGPRPVAAQTATACEATDLGTLTEGDGGLHASGRWTTEDCDSRFRIDSAAHSYRFQIAEGDRIRIDLASDDADSYLYLLAEDGSRITDNDDGGAALDARIERDLAAGTYLVEATTVGGRGRGRADFTLSVTHRFQLKIEETHVPDQVIAGVPFAVHYRAGNPGGGDLSDVGGSVVVYAVAPRVFERLPSIAATPERWQAGVSYHSGAQTASATSVATVEVTPLTVTLNAPGPSWVFVAIIAFDETGEETAFHGIWRNLMVVSGPTFDPLTVNADGADYTVTAEADDEGWVAYSVASVADPDAEVDVSPYVRAIYTAGVQTQLLDGIFERPLIAALGEPAEAAGAVMRSGGGVLSSEGLILQFGLHYRGAVAWSTLAQSVAAGELVTPGAVEDLRLAAAEAAAESYATLAPSWLAFPAGHRGRRGALVPAGADRPHRSRVYRGRALAGRDGRSDRERGPRRRWRLAGSRRPADGRGPRGACFLRRWPRGVA